MNMRRVPQISKNRYFTLFRTTILEISRSTAHPAASQVEEELWNCPEHIVTTSCQLETLKSVDRPSFVVHIQCSCRRQGSCSYVSDIVATCHIPESLGTLPECILVCICHSFSAQAYAFESASCCSEGNIPIATQGTSWT